MKKYLIRLSIILNIIWAFLIISDLFIFPSKGYGKLEKNIYVGIFSSDSVVFYLPKGLTVKDVSAKGISAIDQFENNRFDIVITSDDENVVNYNLPKDSLNYWNNFYSIKKLK